MKFFKTFSVLALAAASVVMAAKNPTVGGKEMYPNKNIIENAVNSADHTTLVAAVKAAGLVEMLEGPGPFTVFAPTNAAFAKLPAGTVDTLLKPESKDTLVKILTYHVVAGRIGATELKKMIKEGHGHHPHSLRDPKPIADFIEKSVQSASGTEEALACPKRAYSVGSTNSVSNVAEINPPITTVASGF